MARHILQGPLLRAKMIEAGYVRGNRSLHQARLAREVGVAASQVSRWLKSEEGTAVDVEVMQRLRLALGASESDLCGTAAQTGDRRERFLQEVREFAGRAGATAVERIMRMDPHHRTILAGQIVGWADAIDEYEKRQKMPLTPLDLEREREAARRLVARVSEAPQPSAPSRRRKRLPDDGNTGDPAR